MTSNNDMPAMPITDDKGNIKNITGWHWDKLKSKSDLKGLTKLEHFAGLAMQGILSGIPVNEVMPSTEIAAMHAVDYAKALLAQLEEKDCE